MPEQVIVFKQQVSFAMRIKKPLVLHIRGAEKDALAALEEVGLPSNWPIHRCVEIFIYLLTYKKCFRHCWNDTWEMCQEWLNKFTNSVVGLTPLITNPHAKDLLNVVEMLPLDRLVLETDAPYFLPRGGGPDGLLGHTDRSFSLPLHVANVAAQVATVKQCTVNEVLTSSRMNIRRVYGV